jgi:hypothetical protein
MGHNHNQRPPNWARELDWNLNSEVFKDRIPPDSASEIDWNPQMFRFFISDFDKGPNFDPSNTSPPGWVPASLARPCQKSGGGEQNSLDLWIFIPSKLAWHCRILWRYLRMFWKMTFLLDMKSLCWIPDSISTVYHLQKETILLNPWPSLLWLQDSNRTFKIQVPMLAMCTL